MCGTPITLAMNWNYLLFLTESATANGSLTGNAELLWEESASLLYHGSRGIMPHMQSIQGQMHFLLK